MKSTGIFAIYHVRLEVKATISCMSNKKIFNVFSLARWIALCKCFQKFLQTKFKNLRNFSEKACLLSFKSFQGNVWNNICNKRKKNHRNEIWGSKFLKVSNKHQNKLFLFINAYCKSLPRCEKNNNKMVLRDCVSRETNMLCGHTITTILRHEGLESQYGKMEKVPLID